MEREELGRVAEMLGKLSESTVKPAQPMSDCAISYVNCTTKKTEVVSLKKGDTFAYGDWDGSRCVRKTYTC